MKHATTSLLVSFQFLFALGSQATLIVTETHTSTGFTVSGSDLLQSSVDRIDDSLIINNPENNANGGGFTSVMLNDGAYNDPLNDGFGSTFNADGSLAIQGGTITYALDTTASPLGYEITSVETFSGWDNPGRLNQTFNVLISTVGDPGNFLLLHTAPAGGLSGTSERIVISDDSNPFIATGVHSVRFDFGDGTTQQNNGVGYKELDVIGLAVIPEPSSLALFALGLGLLLQRRRAY